MQAVLTEVFYFIADDVALVSDAIVGLQNQLNILYQCSALDLNLAVTPDKSNILIL